MSVKKVILIIVLSTISVSIYVYYRNNELVSPISAPTDEFGAAFDPENIDLTGNTLDDKKKPEAIFEEPDLDNLPPLPLPPQITPSGKPLE